MSRIGNQPINLPEKVKIAVSGQNVNVEGPKGKLSLGVHPLIEVVQQEGAIHLKRKDESRQARSLHGLSRSLVANMVQGVTDGFKRELEINGVGYKAELKGKELHMALGFSHPIIFPIPDGISVKVDGRKTKLTIEGIDKQLLGVTAAKIRSFRPPEPYRGKGVKYAEEVIKRKEGKSAGK